MATDKSFLCMQRCTREGLLFPWPRVLRTAALLIARDDIEMFVQQIVLDRGFMAPFSSPHLPENTHTSAGDIEITYTPRQLIFQITKTKIHPGNQRVLLPLRCELHKFYSKWQIKPGFTNRYWRNPHEDHS